MALASAGIPIVTSLAAVIDGHDAVVSDIWGVLHNGVAPFPGAPEALVACRNSGRPVVLLSNAPRPASVIYTQLDRLGVPRDAYDAIVTSGDLARRLIAEHAGAPMLHIGPERDRPLFDGLALDFRDAAASEVVVCTGLYDDTVETPEHYRSLLAGLAARKVAMICANPDITVERGGSIIYCAGALAQLYADLGGPVAYAGKPHPPIYDLVDEVLAGLMGRTPDRRRLLAVGDGLRTDIAGARAVGMPVVFVASQIHVSGPLTAATLDDLFPEGSGAPPIAAMSSLAW
jgi:HAD superfamily hydrolase (TIGR01459 family)